MKIPLTSLTLITSAIPFAFWELDGYVVTQNPDSNSYHVKPINQILEQDQLDTQNYNFSNTAYFILYNKQTGYSISYCLAEIFPPIKIYKAVYKLFAKQQKLINPQKIFFDFAKEKPNINIKKELLNLYEYNDHLKKISFSNYKYFGITTPSNISSTLSNEEREKQKKELLDCMTKKLQEKNLDLQKKYDVQPFQIQSTFTAPSGVTIDNISEGNIKINMTNKQPLDFQKALTAYFDTHDKFTNIEKQLNNAPETNQLAFQKLQNCTILEVYTVRLNEKGQNSIIWGSAQENTKTEEEPKKFHWITELGHDIADVLKEYYAKYVKSS